MNSAFSSWRRLLPLLVCFVSAVQSQTLPSISYISPSLITAGSITAGEGLALTVLGSALGSDSVVKWNGTVLQTTYVSITEVTAVIPASLLANPGTAAVTVTTGGVTTNTLPFTILANTTPTVELFTIGVPYVTAGTGGITETLGGANFLQGATATFGATTLPTTFVSSSALNVNIPASLIALCGTLHVSVTNPGGDNSAARYPNVALRVMPLLRSISPSSIPAGAPATNLTATGAGYTPDCYLAFNGSSLTTTYVNSTTLTATIPALLLTTVGSQLVQVMTSDPYTNSASQPLTITSTLPAPAITSLSPPWAQALGPDFTLTVNGANFAAGAVVEWNGATLPTTFVSSSQLQAAVSAALIGKIDVASVLVASGGLTTAPVSFRITAATPVIQSLSPSSVVAGGQAFTLTVTGSGFAPGALISCYENNLSTVVDSPTQLHGTVPADLIRSAGRLMVVVINIGNSGIVVESQPFPLPVLAPVPTITSLSPASVPAGGPAFTLTINGTNFVQGATVEWNGWGLPATLVSSAQLTVPISAANITTPGNISIDVVTPNGRSSIVQFIIAASQAPGITSLSPPWMIAGGPQFTLWVYGTNLISSTTVLWNGTALNSTFLGRAVIAVAPADLIATAGTANISLINPGTAASAVLPLVISATGCVITRIDSGSVYALGPAFTLGLTGAGFASGAVVEWNGSPLPTSWVSSSSLNAAVAASLIATPGTVVITVLSNGQTSNPVNLTIDPPVPVTSPDAIVNAFSSTPALAPGSLISIYGTGLATGTLQPTSTPLPNSLGGTSVTMNAIPMPLLFVSATQINGQIPYEILPGSASLVIQVGEQQSTRVPVQIKPTAPGVLTAPPGNHVLAQNLPDYSLNSTQQPAVPGQYVTIYMTGQGQVSPAVANGSVAPSTPFSYPLAQVTATIGGHSAPIAFAGLAPGFVGMLQLNLQVPSIPPGDQTLEVTIGGVAAAPSIISVGALPLN